MLDIQKQQFPERQFLSEEKPQIPEMIDPQGRCWDQPDLKNIRFVFVHEIIKWFPFKKKYILKAVMNQVAFNKLKTYSWTQPTGCYIGKMWKCRMANGEFFLCWFDFSSKGPAWCSTKSKPILIDG